MNVRDLLIALVGCAVKDEASDTCRFEKSLHREKAAALFKVSKKHDVAHLVAHALAEIGIELDGEVWNLFQKEKEQAQLRYEMIRGDISEICACFDGAGIDYIPLKGAVVREHYPEPWMRTSCDIDILVREDDLDTAIDSLVEKCGYKTDRKKTYHDVSLYSPFGMHLELHYNIKVNEPKYDKLLTRVWEFSKKGDGNCYLQLREFLMLHLISHGAYHFSHGGCGVKTVLDLWLLNKQVDFDKTVLMELLTQTELVKFYQALSTLGEYWFGGEVRADQTVLEMEKYILLGGVYGTAQQSAVTGQIKKGGKFKYFWSRIFMPYESLVILYPIIKKHKILTPFCQIARWFGALFKRKRISREVKRVAGTEREQIEKTKKLLNDLGL